MNTTPGTPGTPNDGVTSLTLKPGDKVDQFEITQQVGSGGSAVVFAAYDAVLNRTVAVKQVVVPAGEAGDDLRQKAVAEAQNHKRVARSEPSMLVQYIDLVSDHRGLFLITEFVNGPSLEWILQSEPKPMEQRQALGIIAATAKGLMAIHNAGMLHRDLKPSNILLPRGGGLKIGDFGLSAAMNEQQAMDLGSVRYMAPELLQGEPGTEASDVYALGIIAYEMLAGRDKFNEAFRTILRDQRNQAMRWVKWHTNVRAKVPALHTLNPDVPQALSDLVARMMEKEPSRRVATALGTLEAIRVFFATQAQGGVPTPPPHQAMQTGPVEDVSETAAVPKRSKVPMMLAAMLALWIVALGGYFIYKGQQNKQLAREHVNDLAAQVEDANDLHREQDYEQAQASFMQLQDILRDEYNQSSGSIQEDYLLLGRLASAGIERSKGMQHVAEGNFVEATQAFQAYRDTMRDINGDPQRLAQTSLSLGEADRLVESHSRRSDFQLIAREISELLDAGNLEMAVNSIRRQRDITDMAEDDAAILASLDARYRQLRNAERNAQTLTQAEALVAAGDIDEAIDLLEAAIGDDPEAAATSHVEMLASLKLDVRRKASDRAIARAESRDDEDDLIEALGDRASWDPQPEAFAARYNTLYNNRDANKASDLIDDGRLNEAVAILTALMERDPDHRLGQQLMAGIDTQRAFLAKRREAEQAYGGRNYERAITLANEAIDLGGDRDNRMNEIIAQSTGQIALAAATAAFETGDLDTAERQVAIARTNLGNSAEVAALDTRISSLRDYRTLVAEGDVHFRRGEYGPAKRDYLAAREIFSNDQINEMIRDCDFNMWLHACDLAIRQRQWDDAESALTRAEQIKTNDETRQRRQTIEDRIQ